MSDGNGVIEEERVVVPLPRDLFVADYSNEAMCLGEWQDIQVYMPYAAKNASLVLISDSPPGGRVVIHMFTTAAEDSIEIGEDTFRWRAGQYSSGYKEADAQYRLEFGGVFVDGYTAENGDTYFRNVTEPFYLVDCGTEL